MSGDLQVARQPQKATASRSGASLDIATVAAAALSAAESLVSRWLPEGKSEGHEWRCGSLAGERGASLGVNLRTGQWSDFATGEKGGDLVSLYAAIHRVSQLEAAKAVADELGMVPVAPAPKPRTDWTPVLPVPPDAPAPPVAHIKRGRPEAVWAYKDLDGRLLGYVYRFRTSDGGKEVLPLTYTRHDVTGAHEWRWVSFPRPRPLYGLDRLSKAGDVLLVEGEKCADAAAPHWPGPVLTWPGGSNATQWADLRPLAGRQVVCWPDADCKTGKGGELLPPAEQPGQAAMERIARALVELGCTVDLVQVPPPGEQPDGWDVADAIADGLQGQALVDWVQARRQALSGRRQGEAPEARRERQRKEAQAIGDGSASPPPMPDVLTIDEMLEHCVFVADGSRVAFRERPQTALPFQEFKRLMAASVVPIGKRVEPAADLWLADPARITVHSLTFRPGHHEFTQDPDGYQALNIWKPRTRADQGRVSDRDVAMFLGHVEYLVPDDGERWRFLSWLAHIEQFPGALPHTHYLMVTPQTGIGRNWLASLLARVWAGAVRLGFDLYLALNSGFNAELSRRLLVVVDELKANDSGQTAAQQGQQLKALLTAEERRINGKFQRTHVEFNCARFLMFSQHHDALPIEETDRRVVVVDNPVERRPPDYYTRLYERLEDAEFIDNVGRWLAQRDLSGFNPNEPAPATPSKLRAIAAARSDAEKALRELKDSATEDLITASAVQAYLRESGIHVHGARALSAAYAAAGFASLGVVRLNLRTTRRVLAMRNAEKWRQAPHHEIRAALRVDDAADAD